MQADPDQSTKFYGDGILNLNSLIIDEHYKIPTSPEDKGMKEETKEPLEDEDEDDIVMLEDEYEQVVRENQQKQGVKNRNDFNLVKVIGQGSYGKVYLVEDIVTKELFAMKELKK